MDLTSRLRKAYKEGAKVKKLCTDAIFTQMELFESEDFTISLGDIKGLSEEDLQKLEEKLPYYAHNRGIAFTVSKDWELSFSSMGITCDVTGEINPTMKVTSEVPLICENEKSPKSIAGITKLNKTIKNVGELSALKNFVCLRVDMDYAAIPENTGFFQRLALETAKVDMSRDITYRSDADASVFYAELLPEAPFMTKFSHAPIKNTYERHTRRYIVDKGRLLETLIFDDGVSPTLTPYEEDIIKEKSIDAEAFDEKRKAIWGSSPDERWGKLTMDKFMEGMQQQEAALSIIRQYAEDDDHVVEYMENVVRHCQKVMDSLSDESAKALLREQLERKGRGIPVSVNYMEFEFVDNDHRVMANAAARWTQGTGSINDKCGFFLKTPFEIEDIRTKIIVARMFRAALALSEEPYDVRFTSVTK